MQVLDGGPVRVRQAAALSEYNPTLGTRLPLRILLAEDLSVNQKMMMAMLAKMGYRCDLAGNGLEVLEALERQSYDLVLMDVQMPELDGMETTRHIRRHCPPEAQPRIVALTANAMRDDREACTAAGMDEHLSKPVRTKSLEAALLRAGEWAQARSSAAAGDGAGTQPAPAERERCPAGHSSDPVPLPPAIDPVMVSELREMCESCPEVARELVDTFREDSIPLLREVREAIAASDASRLRQAAHGVKGAAANLGGNSLAALCHELEIKGRAGTVDGAEALCPRVEAEFERFCAALDALVRGAE